MPDPNLTSYIQKARQQKQSDKTISDNLIKSGWKREDVKLAISESKKSTPPPPPPQNTGQLISHYGMYDTFAHIILFISLYILAFSIKNSLFIFIDYWLPGASSQINASERNTSIFENLEKILLRIYMAAIIVSYPIFSFVFLRLTKRTILNPGLRNLKSRKVLIYLTLILTFMMILWSFQVTIFALISGGIELNTILWFTTGLIINGSIFAYYLFQIKEDRKVQNAG